MNSKRNDAPEGGSIGYKLVAYRNEDEILKFTKWLMVLVCCFGLTLGCKKAEEATKDAGAAVGTAAEDTMDAAEDAGEDVKDAATDAVDAVEDELP